MKRESDNNLGAMRRAGFTLIELCIGLLITTLVMGGVAAIMSSVGQGWQQGQSTQAMQMQANQIYARMQKVLSGAKYVGQFTAGSLSDPAASPGSIFFWKSDDNSDGIIQTSEMALIQQDPTTHSLFLYQAIPAAHMTTSQVTRAATVLQYSDITNPASPAQFKTLDFVTATALGGPGNQTDNGNLHVNAAQFYVQGMSSAQQLPVIEFSLSLSRSGEQTALYGSTTLRGPSAQPNW